MLKMGGVRLIIIALTVAPAAVRAEVSALPRPTGIVGGFEVEPCAWPSAVFFADDCSGVYIGGKIVLTAAHCLRDTYRIDIDCQNDADCPDVDAFGNELTLTCNQADCPECPPQCSNDTSPVVRGDLINVLFGERYPNLNDDHPRRTIPVQYCRQRGFGDKPLFDFGYCVLSEEPAIQAVPMMMDCEADQFLSQGTPVVAVAFGNEDFDDIPPAFGTKHFLRSTLRFDGSAIGGVSLTKWVGMSPDAGVAPGDSGSPLFIRLPDETWRVVGVASTNAPSYETVWPNVAWMLEDPNVAAEQNKLIPCHTSTGEWEPTAACGQFPLSPDMPSGDWTRGTFACATEDVSGPSATCGLPFTPLNLADADSPPPMSTAREPAPASVWGNAGRALAASGALFLG